MNTNNANGPTDKKFMGPILAILFLLIYFVGLYYWLDRPYQIKHAAEARAVAATTTFVISNWPAAPEAKNRWFDLGTFHDQHWYYAAGAYSNLNDLMDSLHKVHDPMTFLDYPATVEENGNKIETRIIHNVTAEKSLTNGYFLIIYEPPEG